MHKTFLHIYDMGKADQHTDGQCYQSQQQYANDRTIIFLFPSVLFHTSPNKTTASLTHLDLCNIDQRQLLCICIFQTGQKCIGCIQARQTVDACFDRSTADQKSVS